MRFRLIPTDDAFFGLFDESASNVAECAVRLRDLLADPTNAALHEAVEVGSPAGGGDDLVAVGQCRLGDRAAQAARASGHEPDLGQGFLLNEALSAVLWIGSACREGAHRRCPA